MDEQDFLDFNFWPSFSDIMLSVVLVLCLVIAVSIAGTVDLSPFNQRQDQIVNGVASAFRSELPQTVMYAAPNQFSIYLSEGDAARSASETPDIVIKRNNTLQQITFSDQILFAPDRCELNPRGEKVLSIIGMALKNKIDNIREIQIQGHADTDPSKRYESNLDLAAQRAIEVFKFFQHSIGINPAEHLMSVTSFGEFKPIGRRENAFAFSEEELINLNENPKLKSRNRRIEILLFY